jgi:HK97 family phage prohead protease
MPMTPGHGESQDDFMHRCVPDMMDGGRDQDQAIAACLTMYNEKSLKGPQQAYSLLTIKSVQEEQRIIEGVASTPEIDRIGDKVDLNGIEVKLPLPLLNQHDKKQPLGVIKEFKKVNDGLWIRAQIGSKGIADYIDQAWALIKGGLVWGLSVGILPKEVTFMKDTGGMHILKSLLTEVSAVTVPANASASILVVKSLDLAQRNKVVINLPGQSGNSRLEKGHMPKTSVADQIKSWEAEKNKNTSDVTEIVEKTFQESRTVTQDEDEQIKTLNQDNDQIDNQIKILRNYEKQMVEQSAAVTPPAAIPAIDKTVTPRSSYGPIRVDAVAPPGTAFARYVMALAVTKGVNFAAAEYARHQWPDMPLISEVLKTNVEPGTTTATTWAKPLVPSAATLFGEFLDFLRPQTLIGRIPGLNYVPFNVRVPIQTGQASPQWVGEKVAKPVNALAFTDTTLGWAKVAVISVISKELAKFSNPDAEQVVRRSLTADTIQYIDSQFVDPTVAVNAGISPASITNGIVPTAASGITAAAFRKDMATAMVTLLTANQDPRNYVVLMSASVALNLSLLINPLGHPEFPGVGLSGGSILGLPAVVSQAVGARIVIVNAPEILIAQDPTVTIDASEEASLVMTDTPESSPAATSLVSMFQRNYIAIRAELFINWIRARSSAVAYISNATYTGT